MRLARFIGYMGIWALCLIATYPVVMLYMAYKPVGVMLGLVYIGLVWQMADIRTVMEETRRG